MPPRRKASKRTALRNNATVESVFLLLGEDAYLREQFREEIISDHLERKDREFGLARVDLAEESLGEVLGRVMTPGLFATKQVLVLSRMEKIKEDDVKNLEAYFASPPEHAVLIFEAAKLDKRTRAAKLLLNSCEVREADYPTDDAEILEKVLEFAAELKLRLSRDAAGGLVFAVGGNLALLRRELEKLDAYTGSKQEVTAEDVAAVVTQAREFDVFEMAGFLADRRRSEALLRLRRMLDTGVQPIGVIGALAWVFRQLLRARKLPRNAPGWQAAKTLRMQGYRAEVMVRQAHKFSSAQLRRAIGLLLEADIALKSSAPDPEAVAETLVIALTEPVRGQTPAGAGTR